MGAIGDVLVGLELGHEISRKDQQAEDGDKDRCCMIIAFHGSSL
jgi:hypothetical protein